MDANCVLLDGAAEIGDVPTLYDFLRESPNILNYIDIPHLANTPLHTSAKFGKSDFAMEIASLKPSFVTKLNLEGYSPIHLASAGGHLAIVNGLLNIHSDLCLLLGQGMKIPLHCAALEDNVEVMEALLDACPDSIVRLTGHRETALHLAAREGKLGACRLLLRKLRELNITELANWTNRNGRSALEVAESSNPAGDGFVDNFRRLLAENVVQVNITVPSPQSSDFSLEAARGFYLAIVGLVLVITYQGVVIPPGGLWQENGQNQTAGLAILSSRDAPWFTIIMFLDSTGFISSLYLIMDLAYGFPFRFGPFLGTLSLLFLYTLSLFSITPFDKTHILLNVISIGVPIISLFIYHRTKAWWGEKMESARAWWK